MYVSPAQAPYEGVYQRQPTGLPRAEYIPQYPEVPSAPPSEVNNSNIYPQMPNGYQQPPMQYPPQSAYQNNNYGGQMYVPQTNQQPQQVYCLFELIFLIYSIDYSSISKCHHRTNNLNKMLHRKNVIEENSLYINWFFF
jgi:hypothetical protein